MRPDRATGDAGGGAEKVSHEGGCHCGAVRFRVAAPRDLGVLECNCSICSASGFLHLIVARDDFELVRGEDCLVEYRFNTKAARHLFCSRCGVKSFYVPRSHPDGYSVNARCLDEREVRSLTIRRYDGRHWERARADLAEEEAASRSSRGPGEE